MKWLRLTVVLLIMPVCLQADLERIWVKEFACYNQHGIQIKRELCINLSKLFGSVLHDNIEEFKGSICGTGLTSISVLCPRGYPYLISGLNGFREFTLLQLAAFFNAVSIMQWLIDKGCDVNGVANEYKVTPLHFSAYGDFGGMCTRWSLVPHSSQEDPQVIASRHRRLDGVLLLLKAGADPRKKTYWDRSFIDILRGDNHNIFLSLAGLTKMVAALPSVIDKQWMISAMAQAQATQKPTVVSSAVATVITDADIEKDPPPSYGEVVTQKTTLRERVTHQVRNTIAQGRGERVLPTCNPQADPQDMAQLLRGMRSLGF